MSEERPEYHFEYTPEQWAAIVESLRMFDLSAAQLAQLKLKLSWSMIPAWGDAEFREIKADLTKEYQDILRAIQHLDKSVGSRIDDIDLMDGRAYRDPIGVAFENAKPHLDRIGRLIERRIELDNRLLKRLEGQPRVSNNARPFANRMMQFVSSVWLSRGGSINHGKDYKRFFEAVVRPVLSDAKIMHAEGCAWSDGMFRNHVQQMMKKTSGSPGRRGRKPKIQRSAK